MDDAQPATISSALPFLHRQQMDFEQGAKFGLRVDIVAHSGDAIELRGFTKSGSFVFRIEPAGAGSVETFNFEISDIPVIVSTVFNQASFNAPLAYAAVHLTVNGDRVALLMQGTFGSLWGLSWPSQSQLTEQQARGAVVTIAGTTPGAGADVTDNVPLTQIWEILGISVQLGTDSQTADRTVGFQFTDAGGVRFRRLSNATQQADETIVYNFIPGGTTQVVSANDEHEVALPSGILLGPGSTLETVSLNLQTGDVYDAIKYHIRRNYLIGED